MCVDEEKFHNRRQFTLLSSDDEKESDADERLWFSLKNWYCFILYWWGDDTV